MLVRAYEKVGGTFAHDTVCIGSLCTQLNFLMADIYDGINLWLITPK